MYMLHVLSFLKASLSRCFVTSIASAFLLLILECQLFSPRCFLPMRIVKGTAPEAHPEIPQLWNMRGNSRIQLKNGRLIDMITGNSPPLHQPNFLFLFLCRFATVVRQSRESMKIFPHITWKGRPLDQKPPK